MNLCLNEMTTMKYGSLPKNIELCAKFGFHHIELRKGNLIRYLRKGGSLQQLNKLFEQNHVYPASLNAIENISFQQRQGIAVVKELGDFLFFISRALGCGCVEAIASFHVPTTSEKEILVETVKSLLRLSDIAANYDVKLALEFMAVPGSSIKTFEQCLAIVDTVNRDNVGMLLDTWHFYAMGGQPEDILCLKPSQLFMVHVSDCPKRTPGTALRTESYWPGDGVIPLELILRNLQTIGYDGMCSIEVMDPNVHLLPPDEGIQMAQKKLSQLLNRAGIKAE